MCPVEASPRPIHKVEISIHPESRGFQAKPIRSDGVEDRWQVYNDLEDLISAVAGWIEEGLHASIPDMQRMSQEGQKKVHAGETSQVWISDQLRRRPDCTCPPGGFKVDCPVHDPPPRTE